MRRVLRCKIGHRRTTSSPGLTSEAHTDPSSSTGDRDFYPASQGPVVETDAAITNLSKGDGFLAGEGGGHEATSLEEELLALAGGDTTGSSEDEHDGLRPGQGSAEGASAGVHLRRCGIDSHHCLVNVGGHHRGNVLIRKITFPALLGEWEVIVCEATNEIMNSRIMAEAYNLDPNQQAELFQLQRTCPDAIPGYESTSEDEDDSGAYPLGRLQPCTGAIIGNLQPRGSRYIGSCCKDAMLTWSQPYLMRFANGPINAKWLTTNSLSIWTLRPSGATSWSTAGRGRKSKGSPTAMIASRTCIMHVSDALTLCLPPRPRWIPSSRSRGSNGPSTIASSRGLGAPRSRGPSSGARSGVKRRAWPAVQRRASAGAWMAMA